MDARLSRNILKTVVAIAVMVCAGERLEAQVGLASGMANVNLVARSAPHGMIQIVGSQRKNGRVGALREMWVTVRVSANTGYQLRVRRLGGAGRIWVRTARGDFQELIIGIPVPVARTERCAGACEHEVQFRVEAAETGAGTETLPVRYGLLINPTL